MDQELSDEALQDLYSWIDEIKLSRPKRNISRDFSDGGNTDSDAPGYSPLIPPGFKKKCFKGVYQFVSISIILSISPRDQYSAQNGHYFPSYITFHLTLLTFLNLTDSNQYELRIAD